MAKDFRRRADIQTAVGSMIDAGGDIEITAHNQPRKISLPLRDWSDDRHVVLDDAGQILQQRNEKWARGRSGAGVRIFCPNIIMPIAGPNLFAPHLRALSDCPRDIYLCSSVKRERLESRNRVGKSPYRLTISPRVDSSGGGLSCLSVY